MIKSILKSTINFTMGILETVVFIGSIYIVIYLYLFMPTQVQGASMEPTFHSGDRVILSKISYKLHEPQRGDVIAFQSPQNQDIEFFKRIIGVPGDKIEITNGSVYVNGQKMIETYTFSPTNIYQGEFLKEGETVIISQRKLFVMGDNRQASFDSRAFGFIPISSIEGKAIYRYFPPQTAGFISATK